ncbi:MAG: efflux RND transporter permease subunit, partial [Acidobacteriota bacterium]
MSLGKLATERPVTLAMTAISVVIFGLVALTRLPVSLLPEVSYPTLTVEAKLPGAAPIEVESLLAKPIEEAVGVVSGVERITSTSRPGVVSVALEFGWGRDMDVAAMDVRQKLDLVTLPRDAEKPRVLRYDPTEDPVIRVGLTGSRNLARLRHYADSVLKRRLDSVDGVAAIKILGGEIQEIQVDLDEGRLQEAGLTHQDVVRALAASNVNVAGGSLYEDEARYLVRTSNELQTPEDVAAIPLVPPSPGARPIARRDVAPVTLGNAERDVITRLGGREAVELQVFKEGDANAVRVAQRFHAALAEAKKALPPELQTVVIYDQSHFINDAIGEVNGNAIAGGIIAIMVLLLFLRDLRSTLIISVSIPISVVATFFVMYQLGVSLNVMSLGGLALGVGMVVDDSIVVLEAIMKRREAGESLLVAAIHGTEEIGMAVMATTLTTVVVFVPLIFLHGVAAQLFRDQAITVTASLMASLVVSLTLIPMLCSRGARTAWDAAARRGKTFRLTAFLLRIARKVGGAMLLAARLLAWPLDRAFTTVWHRLERSYPSILAVALRRPYTVLGVGTALSVLALLPALHLPLDLIPPLHEGEILIDLEAAEGTALEGTARQAEDLERVLAASPLVESVFTTVGGESQRQASVSGSGQNLAQLHVVMKDRGSRKDEASVLALARQTLSSAPGLVYRFDRPGTFSLRAPIEVEVYGDDVATLTSVAQDLGGKLASLPFLSDVKTDARLGNPEVQIRFDRERLARLSLEPAAVADALRGRLQGEVATRITDGDRDVDVRVRARGLAHSSPEELSGLVVASVSGAPVTLGDVAAVSAGTGPSEIRRIGQRRAAVITANLAGLDLGAASARIRETLASYPLPSGIYPPELSGQSKELGRSMRELGFALLLATFLVYFVMASEFESLLHPLMIMFTVPIGVAGSLFALWVTGQPLSVVAIIGIVLLVGIVVDNAIILVDCANQKRGGG